MRRRAPEKKNRRRGIIAASVALVTLLIGWMTWSHKAKDTDTSDADDKS